MPIYEYVCDKCQTSFEKLVLNKQQEIACPNCASKNNILQLSVFSASTNGATPKSSTSFSCGGGGGCCGGGCACN